MSTFRLRLGALRGTILNDPLTIDGTSLVVAHDPRLSQIDEDHYLPLILDELGEGGAQEVAHGVAYANDGSLGDITVVRAREGSIARAHNAGTIVVHGPTLQDFPLNPTPMVRVSHTAPANVTSTATATVWNTAEHDPYGFWDVSAPAKLTVPAGLGGTYLANYQVAATSTTTTNRLQARVQVNGVTIGPVSYDTKSGTGSWANQATVTMPLVLVPGDEVTGNVDCSGTFASVGAYTGLQLVRIGP